MNNTITINFEVSSNNSATISSGVYNTSSYTSKEYTTKSGLVRGLRANGFTGTEVYNGQTWNYCGNQHKITFSN